MSKEQHETIKRELIVVACMDPCHNKYERLSPTCSVTKERELLLTIYTVLEHPRSVSAIGGATGNICHCVLVTPQVSNTGAAQKADDRI